MKILLTSGILPPEIGGPANYVRHLSEELLERGHRVGVIAYGAPTGIRGVKTLGVRRTSIRPVNLARYCRAVLREGRDADFLVTFDLMSAGLPTVLAGLCLGKKVILRLGGDFFWERDVNRGREFCPLPAYYGKKSLWRDPASLVARFILGRVDRAVFSSGLLEGIYVQGFPGLKGKTLVIQNPYPDLKDGVTGEVPAERGRRFVYAGRLIRLKNLSTLIEVFGEISRELGGFGLDIYGEGPEKENLLDMVRDRNLDGVVRIEGALPHEEVLKRIKGGFACILPSLSEVSPNFGLECLRLGKPLIITKYNGLPGVFERHAVQVDPLDPQDIKEKIVNLAKGGVAQPPPKPDEIVSLSRSWKDVTREFLAVLDDLDR